MSCLPGHKVPRLGTPGEKARERQLMLQLPKQDLALAYTRHVETQYHTSFTDFVAARNDIALDIAVVKLNIPDPSVSWMVVHGEQSGKNLNTLTHSLPASKI